MTFWNERQGALIINKLSSLDRKTPLEGVTFKITTATVEFVPDENGKISSNGLYYTCLLYTSSAGRLSVHPDGPSEAGASGKREPPAYGACFYRERQKGYGIRAGAAAAGA